MLWIAITLVAIMDHVSSVKTKQKWKSHVSKEHLYAVYKAPLKGFNSEIALVINKFGY